MHGVLQQLQLGTRLRQQRVGRHHGGDRRGCRTAQPGGQRNALVDRKLKAETGRLRIVQRDDRAAGGVLRSLQRQILHHAANGLDGPPGRRAAPRRHAIADRVDRKAQNIEANGDVADRCGRKRGGDAASRPRCGIAHRRAPR